MEHSDDLGRANPPAKTNASRHCANRGAFAIGRSRSLGIHLVHATRPGKSHLEQGCSANAWPDAHGRAWTRSAIGDRRRKSTPDARPGVATAAPHEDRCVGRARHATRRCPDARRGAGELRPGRDDTGSAQECTDAISCTQTRSKIAAARQTTSRGRRGLELFTCQQTAEATGRIMQHTTIINERTDLRKRRLRATPLLLAIAALAGCEEQASSASTPSVNDSAGAYAALSASLEECDASYDACTAASDGSSGALAQCQSEAESCRSNTQQQEADAEASLENEAQHCRKQCSDDDAGPGVIDDADGGSGDMHGCLSAHAPKLPECVSGLFACLDDAGFLERSATRADIHACLHEAHACFMSKLAERRAERRGRRHAHMGPADAGVSSEPADASADEHRWPRPFWKR